MDIGQRHRQVLVDHVLSHVSISVAMAESLQIRELIDKYFSLQWCRENIVVPLGVEKNEITGSEKLTIAIGNFSYLATIGDFIKKRASQAGMECQFIEKPAQDIQAFLDQAAQQRLISGEGLETFEFSDDSILDALKEAEGDSGTNLGFDFDYDDGDEQIIEEQALDLAMEMMGTKIQQAAAKILINSAPCHRWEESNFIGICHF